MLVLASCCLLLAVAAHAVDPRDPDPEFLYDSFPKGFMWGTSVAAGQVEGGWNADGRGPSIWDVYARSGAAPLSGDLPDVTCDVYHKWREDIQLIKNLGLTHYRFSISWSRVLPNGKLGNGTGINEKGIKWYSDFIDALLEAGVQPMVTLFHNDLPQALQDEFGGMLSKKVIPHYVDYARLMFQRFGDRVKWWSTFNEIHIWAGMAYGYYGTHAPGDLSHAATYPYIATQNCLLAHAEAWHVYDKEFRKTQKGKIGITLDFEWKEPLDANNPDDVAAAEREIQLTMGLIAHPIFSKTGDWPKIIKDQVAKKSSHLKKSRLPAFTKSEIKRLRGSADYYSVNQYSASLFTTKISDPTASCYSYTGDSDTAQSWDTAHWPGSGASWLFGVPWGIRKVLNYIKDHYNNPPVIITENGVAEINPAHTKDPERISWLRDYTNNVLKAIKKDGCNVIGYTVWSMMDNYEWASGFSARFGLVQVDFNDPNRPRTPKDSYYWYKQLIKDNGYAKGKKSASF